MNIVQGLGTDFNCRTMLALMHPVIHRVGFPTKITRLRQFVFLGSRRVSRVLAPVTSVPPFVPYASNDNGTLSCSERLHICSTCCKGHSIKGPLGSVTSSSPVTVTGSDIAFKPVLLHQFAQTFE